MLERMVSAGVGWAKIQGQYYWPEDNDIWEALH
jgi:hypothetical protein